MSKTSLKNKVESTDITRWTRCEKRRGIRRLSDWVGRRAFYETGQELGEADVEDHP